MTPRSRKSLAPRRPAPARRPRGMVQRPPPGPESCCCTEGRRRWQRARRPRPPPAPSCSPWPGLCWRRARPEVSRRAQAAPRRSPAVPARPLGTRPPGAPRAALGVGDAKWRDCPATRRAGTQLRSPRARAPGSEGTPAPPGPHPRCQFPGEGGSPWLRAWKPPARSPGGPASGPLPRVLPSRGSFARVSVS